MYFQPGELPAVRLDGSTLNLSDAADVFLTDKSDPPFLTGNIGYRWCERLENVPPDVPGPWNALLHEHGRWYSGRVMTLARDGRIMVAVLHDALREVTPGAAADWFRKLFELVPSRAYGLLFPPASPTPAEAPKEAAATAPETTDGTTPETPRRKGKRGRKPAHDPGLAKRVREAWEAGSYPTKAALADALHLPSDDVKRMLDNGRKARAKAERASEQFAAGNRVKPS